MDRTAVVNRIIALIAEHGSQDKAAKRLRLSPAYLSDVLNGRREPGDKMLSALKLKRVVQYEAR